MEKDNRRYFLRKREEEKRVIEGEITLRAPREGCDLLDFALEAIDQRIIYPSPAEWQRLTRHVGEHVCAPQTALDALTGTRRESAMVVPEESEWAALTRAVRQRVVTREPRTHLLRRYVEALQRVFAPVGRDDAAIVLVLILGICFFAAMTYMDVTFFAAQANAHLFQPIADRTAYINELIAGKAVVAAAPFAQRYYSNEEGRG